MVARIQPPGILADTGPDKERVTGTNDRAAPPFCGDEIIYRDALPLERVGTPRVSATSSKTPRVRIPLAIAVTAPNVDHGR